MYTLLLLFFLVLILLPLRGVQAWVGFSHASTQYLKLILTLAILWHHLPPLGEPLVDHLGGVAGRYGVSAFFFLSGFGLMAGLRGQGREAYFRSFFRRRLSKLLVPLILAFGCYAIFRWEHLGWDYFLSNWEHGHNFVSFSYFVEELCTLYILFYLIFRFFSQRIGLLLAWCSSALLMYIYASLNYHEHWWISTLAFPSGVTLASLPLHAKARGYVALAAAMLVACYLAARLSISSDYAPVIYALFMTPLVSVLCYLILPFIKTNITRPSSWIVNASYEIYLLQGLLISLVVSSYGREGASLWLIFLILLPVSYMIYLIGRMINRKLG